MKTFTRIWLGISLLAIAFGAGIVITVAVMHQNRKDIRTFSFSDTYDNVDSLDFIFNYGGVQIKEGNGFSITAENVSEEKFKSYVSNGVWYIREKCDTIINIFGKDVAADHFTGWDKDDSQKITITVPKDFVAKECTLNIGAGEVDAENICAEEGYFKVGAGKLNIEKLSINKKSKYEIGAGSMKIGNLVANDTDFDCGIGDIAIDGTLKGDNDIKCGIGRIKLDLNGNEKDFSYELKAGLGSVAIDGNSYHNVSKNIDNDTDNRLHLDCGVGSIDVNFH